MRNPASTPAFKALAVALCIVGVAGFANAQITVTGNIAVSQTWTADNVYDLQDQIYVLPGATLTIEAGTVIASSANGGLAVTKGAQIFVLGTQTAPVIMTSAADRATWTGGDPTTGTWRASANEWGNLTIMGDGYISEDATPGNSQTCSASNFAAMEGLVQDPMNPTLIEYGGGNDDDDSGTIRYLSIRYGGDVLTIQEELNGLSLGGIGRGTDIHHVEIMNNVDDGIEIWGGCVNLKYFSIWNVGDDSLDVDQGWRGKAQFGLIVQGYSIIGAGQGSGVGDNACETDGAENSDAQPVTTTTIYNLTVIGEPNSGDGLTTWRDNANVQYRNCIFMDGGEKVVRFDNLDGDGAQGYGFNGTLGFATRFQTPYTTTSPVNACANPAAIYKAQSSGNLCEITDSVFYNNGAGNAYTEAQNIDGSGFSIFGPGSNNVQEPLNSPITSITRAAPVIVFGTSIMERVSFLDPRPANDALTSAATAPADGFFTPAAYRGAFAPGENWLCGWTASDAFGMTPGDYLTPGTTNGQAATANGLLDINGAFNQNCEPVDALTAGPHYANLVGGEDMNITVQGEPNQIIVLVSGPLASANLPLSIGLFDINFAAFTIVADGSQPDFFNSLWNTGPGGVFSMDVSQSVAPGSSVAFQAVVFNSVTTLQLSNAVQVDFN